MRLSSDGPLSGPGPGGPDRPDPGGPPAIGPDAIVADVVARRPDLLDVFVAFGFRQLLNPVLRRTVARKTTIRLACDLRGVDLGEFLGALNSGGGGATSGPSIGEGKGEMDSREGGNL